MVFGSNTASDISKLSNIPRAAKRRVVFGKFEILRAGIIAKYYVQVTLLFVYKRSREIFGNAQETFLFTVKKKNKQRRLRSQQSFYVNGRNDWQFLWNQYKPFKANNMKQFKKVIYKSRLFRSLQRWYNKATLLYHRFLLLYHYYAEIVML